MLKDKKLFLFDIDGTIAIGNTLIDGAVKLFDYIKEIGGKYIFITNNSTKGVNDYVDKFKKLNVEVDESNFITAGYASAVFLEKDYKKNKIFCVGTSSFVSELKAHGLMVTEKYSKQVDCVIVGFDNELVYRKIEDACRLLSKDSVMFFATNPDLVCPVDFGFVPDCGSICQMIENSVKRKPNFIGKPNKLMVDICLENNDYSKEETIIIGDRLYTDILCGVNSNIDTIAVLTGETGLEEIEKSIYKPTYIFKNIKELFISLTEE